MPLHKKINAKEDDPNPNISFISVLKDQPDADEALIILKSIAAQFRPICEEHHLYVNSLEEAPWNTQFAGRNWNAGEVIELVLRNKDGQFQPIAFIAYVMAHELAHIYHMNHLAGFQRFNKQLRQELRALQARGYYGNGFYSSGRVIRNGLIADGLNDRQMKDLPEHICGATGKKKRRGGYKRSTHRRQRLFKVVKPGSAGGEQKSLRKGPKAGSRVRSTAAFVGQGEGNTLSTDPDDSTFRKQANSKSAKERRADAAEKRMREAARAVEQAADSQSNDEIQEPDEDQQRQLNEMDAMADDLEVWADEDLNAVDESENEEIDELESRGDEMAEEEREALWDEKANFVKTMHKFRTQAFSDRQPPEASSSKKKVDVSSRKPSPEKSKAGSRSVSPAKKPSSTASTLKNTLSPAKRKKAEEEDAEQAARAKRRANNLSQTYSYFGQPPASASASKDKDKGRASSSTKPAASSNKKGLGSKSKPIELD